MAYTNLTNDELRNAFKNGRTLGRANNMTIEKLNDGTTALVGYGWAIYATRDPDGTVTVYPDWARWALEQNPNAEATPRHIRKLRSMGDNTRSGNPRFGPTPNSVRDVGHLAMRDRDNRK